MNTTKTPELSAATAQPGLGIEKLFNTQITACVEKLFETKIAAVEKLLTHAVEDLDKRFVTSVETVATHTKELAEAAQKATDIAAVALERRLAIMNEFRATLSDQAINFYTRQEHDLFAKSVESDIRLLRESRAEVAGMAKMSQLYFTLIVAGVGAFTGIVGLVLRFLK